MASESLRKKLEFLLRSSKAGRAVSPAKLLRTHGHSGVNRPQTDQPSPDAQTGPPQPAETAQESAPKHPKLADLTARVRPIPLPQACPGAELEIATPAGGRKCWLVRRTLAEVAPESRAIAAEYARVMRGARQRFDELDASAALCHAANATPEELLFADTETCGLVGAVVFLVGLMRYERGELVFEQYLARDYSEEPAILQAFLDRYGTAGLLVTFNGKAFDMTLIRERLAFHHLPEPWTEPEHLDLLHEARRLWKGRVPNYKLQTLEQRLCGRRRSGDIPGHAIPDAYHRFVHTQDARAMRDILQHNLLDLLTMAQLVTFALTGDQGSLD